MWPAALCSEYRDDSQDLEKNLKYQWIIFNLKSSSILCNKCEKHAFLHLKERILYNKDKSGLNKFAYEINCLSHIAYHIKKVHYII